MQSADDLSQLLRRIDGRGYKAYRDLRGAFSLTGSPRGAAHFDATLFVDHVQGDPFAAPSLLRVRVPMDVADIPDELFRSRIRRLALCDSLARAFRTAIRHSQPSRGRAGSGKSGVIEIDAGGQEVLERSAVVVESAYVEARFELGLPANGRRVRGGEAERLLLDVVPTLAERSLCHSSLDQEELRTFVQCVEAQEWLRAQLDARGLVAFVADGSLLPRASGVSDRPMDRSQAIPFESPASMRVEFELPEAVGSGEQAIRRLQGLGIPRGVTLIAGGGYHGKSTLLQALERAVHPHVPGDGREWIVSHPLLAKVRAEDGRAVTGSDIRAFVRELPRGAGAEARSTEHFSTDDASGSTSQAANIVEAIEAGATGLLLDEDTSATNLLVRDARMQALVRREAEPITPFLERVRELYESWGISTVMVMGGCGDYFDVADQVLLMQNYRASDASEEARRVAERFPKPTVSDGPTPPLQRPAPRTPLREGFDPSSGRRDVKIGARGLDQVLYGRQTIEVRGLEQLVDPSQTRAIANALLRLDDEWIDDERTLPELLDRLEEELDERGLDILDPYYRAEQHPGRLARPRRLEIAGTVSRMRSLRIRGG